MSARVKTRSWYRDYEILGAMLVAALVLVFIPLLPLDGYTFARVTQTMIFVGLTISWGISGGFAGQLSLGHAAFFGAGAYASAEVMRSTSLGVIPALLVGVVAGTVVSAIVIPAFRARGAYFAILTVALASIAGQVAQRFAPGGNSGIFFGGFSVDSRVSYFFAAGGVVAALASTVVMTHSRLGRALVAVRLDLDAARSIGVRDIAARSQAMLLSGGVAGYFGGVFALNLGFLDPDTAFSLDWSIAPLLGAVLGGVGTVFGPVIGGTVWALIDEMLSVFGVAGDAALIIEGGILLAVAIAAPKGLWGIGVAIRTRWMGRSNTTTHAQTENTSHLESE